MELQSDPLLADLEELYRSRFRQFLRVARAILGDGEGRQSGRVVRRGLLALAGVALGVAATGAGIAGMFLTKSPAQEEQGLLDGAASSFPQLLGRYQPGPGHG